MSNKKQDYMNAGTDTETNRSDTLKDHHDISNYSSKQKRNPDEFKTIPRADINDSIIIDMMEDSELKKRKQKRIALTIAILFGLIAISGILIATIFTFKNDDSVVVEE